MHSALLFVYERLPFDTKNPIGFIVAGLIQYVFGISLMITIECLAIIVFGTYFMLFPLTKDIKRNLKMINFNAKRRKSRLKIGNRFSQFVQFHSKLLQLSHEGIKLTVFQMNQRQSQFPLFFCRLIHDLSNLMKLILIVALIWSIAGICSMMLLLKLKLV